jgi:hypothetical protein
VWIAAAGWRSLRLAAAALDAEAGLRDRPPAHAGRTATSSFDAQI